MSLTSCVSVYVTRGSLSAQANNPKPRGVSWHQKQRGCYVNGNLHLPPLIVRLCQSSVGLGVHARGFHHHRYSLSKPDCTSTLKRLAGSVSEIRSTRHSKGSGGASTNIDADNDQVCTPDFEPPSEKQRVGSDFPTLARRFWKVAVPYWSSEDKVQARWRLAGVLALTLATTGISVGFNFLGRDFYNALSSKDQEQFVTQLLYYLGAFIVGIPVFVIRDYSKDVLSLRWRAWATKYYMDCYFENRTFYSIQSQSLIDNPDQRIVDDLSAFTATSLGFALALFNATIDLISFSGILYGIYPPLFVVLVVYSLGGTAISVALGKGLVGLNFMQEKREADFRYGMVRVRENAESIAFYGGEGSEIQLLLERFKQSFDNYSKLLVASRNLDFFTSGYRYLIQLLPAAVVAPLYFSGKIEFGVINQSFSAFNHILSDFSIIVYQFQSISAFSAVIDRLGEFSDVLDQQQSLSGQTIQDPEDSEVFKSSAVSSSVSRTRLLDVWESGESLGGSCDGNPLPVPLLEIENLTLKTPQYTSTLVENLSLVVNQGENLLIMGASGSGKTSLLRAIAGLWRSGHGSIKRYLQYESDKKANGAMRPAKIQEDEGTKPEVFEERSHVDSKSVVEPSFRTGQMVFFLPQRPYMVLGTLRQQVLYPTWNEQSITSVVADVQDSTPLGSGLAYMRSVTERPQPSDEELIEVLERVRLCHLMNTCDGLDSYVEWASVLSLGEQQRIAFARLLISCPRLALMDESTSALDEENEMHLYREIQNAGITYVSVGHRSSLLPFHSQILTIRNSTSEDTVTNWTLATLLSPYTPKQPSSHGK